MQNCHRSLILIFCCIGLFLQCHVCEAQISLDFKRINLLWPTVELYFSLRSSDGKVVHPLREQLRVTENDFEVPELTLHPPHPTPCPMSVALVLDASGSMQGAGNEGAKAGAKAFVRRMDGTRDEAALVEFSTNPRLKLGMTSDTAQLVDSINTLPAWGGTTIWDGIWMGIEQVVQSGVNDCRAVVALTDGGDGSSSHYPGDIIPFANREHIRVFTIGLGSSINTTELELIAMLTGGRFFHTSHPSALPAIYDSIATIIKDKGFGERMITYNASCMDGTLRRVDLTMIAERGDSLRKTKSYRAPLDPSTARVMPLHLRAGDVQGGHSLLVSLRTDGLFDPLIPLHPRFVLPTGEPGLRFDSVWVPSGSPFESGSLVSTVYPDSVVLHFDGPLRVMGTGPLLHVLYETTEASDTVSGRLYLHATSSGSGCARFTCDSAAYNILPEGPSVVLNARDVPECVWDQSAQRYEPPTVELRYLAENHGLAAAEQPEYTLYGYETALLLLNPVSSMQPGSETRIEAGRAQSVSWLVEPARRARTDTIRLGMVAAFANHAVAVAESKIIIHSSLANLECSLGIPDVLMDSVRRRFETLPVTLTVHNHGGAASDSIYAEIELSGGLQLEREDPAQTSRRLLTPAVLAPGAEGHAAWRLQLPASKEGEVSSVAVRLLDAGQEPGYCSASIAVPPLDTNRVIGVDIQGRTLLCPGDSATLVAEPGFSEYVWSNSRTGPILTVSQAGQYHVEAVDNAGTRRKSDVLFISEAYLPTVNVYATNYTPCVGDTVRLYTSWPMTSYLWSTGDTTQSIFVTASATYDVIMLTRDGCTATASRAMTFAPYPELPIISRSFDTLYTEVVALNHDWYRNGNKISSGKPFHVARSAGRYSVVASNGGKCTATSNEFDVSVLATDNAASAPRLEMNLYPDPVDAQLEVHIVAEIGDHVSVSLVDLLGRSTVLSDVVMSQDRHTLCLPVAHVPPGVYMLLLRGEGGQIVRRFRKL